MTDPNALLEQAFAIIGQFIMDMDGRVNRIGSRQAELMERLDALEEDERDYVQKVESKPPTHGGKWRCKMCAAPFDHESKLWDTVTAHTEVGIATVWFHQCSGGVRGMVAPIITAADERKVKEWTTEEN